MINTLIYGNCLDILPKIETESIDCVITDCPYKIIAGGIRIINEGDECGGILNKRDYLKTNSKGCLNKGKIVVSDGTNCSNKWLKKNIEPTCLDEKMKKNIMYWYNNKNTPCAVKDGKMFDNNDIKFEEWLPEIYRVLKKGTHCYIMINGRNLKELQIQAEKVGFEYQNLLIWDKGNLTPNKYYMQGAEFILMLSKRPARNINNMGTSNILRIKNIIGYKNHPTQKPVELMKILINNSTNKGDLILDPFAGTGATLLGCKLLERNYIGIEIDKKYVEIFKENNEYKKLKFNI